MHHSVGRHGDDEASDDDLPLQLPDPLVRYIHPSPQAQIFGAEYNPKVPQRLKYSQSQADE